LNSYFFISHSPLGFFAPKLGSDSAGYSKDGLSWTSIPLPGKYSGSAFNWNGSQLSIVLDNAIFSTDDLTHWTKHYDGYLYDVSDIMYDGTQYFAVNARGQVWTSANLGTPVSIRSPQRIGHPSVRGSQQYQLNGRVKSTTHSCSICYTLPHE